VEYKNKLYQAESDYGNMAKPDDLCSRALYEIFNYPSRSFAWIHVFYGFSILLYTFFALYQKRGVSVFIAQEIVSFLMMFNSFNASMGRGKDQLNIRGYAFTN
jgi:hypothetical protein